ncbi:MAG TPA: C25 family cysteine peptidase [Chitinophagaceae bacterium]|nr:T9SS type A sorting domain-containing protein [Chitinophagaceae bacterium]HMZ46143.1 C25 family cysteine peptidase [Chitinophagaceae bacterium]HNM33408.1 C25 family cysteine peptidase [Chitinophagaceae bacterium]
MKHLLLTFFIVCFGNSIIAQPLHNEWIDYSKTYYKFKVDFGIHPVTLQPIKRKLVRITKATLDSVGLGNTNVEQFKLFRNGVEVPIFTSTTSGVLDSLGYIEFWGEINDGKLDKELYRDADYQLSDIWSLQEDNGTYFLTTSNAINKRLVNTANNVIGNLLSPTLYFMNTVMYTQRQRRFEGYAAQSSLPLHSSSYDKGEGYATRPIRPIGSSCGQVSFTINFTNLKPYLSGPPMTLKVNTMGSENNTRTILVKINGNSVSNYQMDYFNYAKVEESGIPVSYISSGNAAVLHINQSPVDCDEFRLIKDELTYPRTLDGDNNVSLELKLPATATGHYLKFFNFNSGANSPILYDITNGKRYIADKTINDTLQFVTNPSLTAYNLVLVNNDSANIFSVSTLQQRNFVNYQNIANQGDYIIISNPLIYGTGNSNYVEQYKQYRSSTKGGSYNAIVVDINEITDQFAFGINKHPLSVRNFLRYARNIFTTTPKYVFIIGKGLNYIDFRSNEDEPDMPYQNLVPTWGHPASDNLLSAADNLNPTPITPIGRLSAVSANEVGDYLKKIKQYDSLQQAPLVNIEDKTWMKNVLHIGGATDYNIGTSITNYLNKYTQIIEDTLFGAKVKKYNKLDNPAGYGAALVDFKNTYESGASIITYFGHSSANLLDFNLDNPNAYNNPNKYPVFIVNGCDAGNFLTYEPQRLNIKTSISEKFVLAPERGAIGYLATTGYGAINYLDTFTTGFYRALSTIDYNKPFGESIKDGIINVLNTTGLNDFFARYHAEQFIFHGDPALKLNTFPLPDLVLKTEYTTTLPTKITVAKDSFYLKMDIYNIGKKINDSINLKITRQYPKGNSEVVLNKKLPAIALMTTETAAFPIIANRDKGTTILTATIDATNSINEMDENNNTAVISVSITDDEIVPIYPYNYAIVNNSNFKLAASTANPLDTLKNYIVEVDTTSLFNSPIKYTQNKSSVGGVVEFDYGLTLQNNTTYFWRVATQGSSYWNTVSFTYKSSPDIGFEQRHFLQHTDSKLTDIILDSSSRKFKFGQTLNNLFVVHSIYPYSGTEDQHFSIKVNGTGIIASACLGNSVIINVFDTLSFNPWINTTNPFGATPTCLETRKYNFEYSYLDVSGRNNAKSFLESIPNGMLVAVRMVYDGASVWANDWANDTLLNGSGNSLYHFLKNQGFAIDSFNHPRTFAFIFKKNDSLHFTPKYLFSEGLYDRVILNADYNSDDTLGYVVSPKFGPAKAWKFAKWNGNGNGSSFAKMNIIGIDTNGIENVLFNNMDTLQTSFDISSINAQQYPFVKLSILNQDSVKAFPYQLSNWSVEYVGVPEGAVAPNLHINIPDTIGLTSSYASDTLKGSFAFKNVSKENFDSLTVKVVLTNLRLGTVHTFNLAKTKPLLAGDTLHINFAIDASLMSRDEYNLYVAVNENAAQPEQYLFNNFLYKYIYFKTSVIVPVKLLNLTAKINGTGTDITWQVAEEVNVLKYEVEHSNNAIDFKTIGSVDANGKNNYLLHHAQPTYGKNYYRLKILNTDGSYNYSTIRLVNFGKGVIVNVYPNPVIGKLNIAVSNNNNKQVQVNLYNNYGQLLFTEEFKNNSTIDMSKLSSGVYILQVNDGIQWQTFRIVK